MLHLLLSSFLIQSTASYDFVGFADDGSWECGIGPVTNTLAFIAALPVSKTNYVDVNSCCKEHDWLIDEMHVAREEADRIFCDCLDSRDSWYVRHIIKPAFCNLVKLYSWFASSWEDNVAKEQHAVTASWMSYLRPDRSRSGY